MRYHFVEILNHVYEWDTVEDNHMFVLDLFPRLE